jgi:hypothetical protein
LILNISLRWRFVPAFFWPFGAALASAEIFRQARQYVPKAGAADHPTFVPAKYPLDDAEK